MNLVAFFVCFYPEKWSAMQCEIRALELARRVWVWNGDTREFGLRSSSLFLLAKAMALFRLPLSVWLQIQDALTPWQSFQLLSADNDSFATECL